MRDYCLELSKIKVLKMLDLQTKSAIDSNNLQVQHQATHRAFTPSILRSIYFVIFYRLPRLIGGFSNGQETNL
jgi:hypothetical protein